MGLLVLNNSKKNKTQRRKRWDLIEIYKVKRNRKNEIVTKQPKGVLVAGLTEDDRIAIGYSLCHKTDRFDYIHKHIKTKGLGKKLAKERAIKWASRKKYIEPPKVPVSIKNDILKFIDRCTKFYKMKKFVPWVENYLRGYFSE